MFSDNNKFLKIIHGSDKIRIVVCPRWESREDAYEYFEQLIKGKKNDKRYIITLQQFNKKIERWETVPAYLFHFLLNHEKHTVRICMNRMAVAIYKKGKLDSSDELDPFPEIQKDIEEMDSKRIYNGIFGYNLEISDESIYLINQLSIS